ncbi:MAG: hypothetical protein NTV56_02550 [Alphaproteobacteria bacterium]|nr:hypothetical protein [Alphaproteobacteria bacterium]
MPSEWAKRVECWDAIREGKLELPAHLPPELTAPATSADGNGFDPVDVGNINEAGTDLSSLILRIRPLFARETTLRRDALPTRIAELMGYAATDPKAQVDTEHIIQAAIKRGILQEEDGDISLLGRNISAYPRDVLKEQFLASMNGNNWMERSESIPRFARWLGFKRTGPNIEEAARSVINSLIRADRLEKTGSQIRRI